MSDSAHLQNTRTAYDAIASLYAEQYGDPRHLHPLDRAMIGAFAEVAGGPVLDAGCGPGHITAHLRGLGCTADGVDLSRKMIAHARTAHPAARFTEGTMTDLPAADGSLGGVLAWYSIIHTPPGRLAELFAEFRRVLAPGGHLLLGFFAADGAAPEPFDHKVTLAYRLPMDRVCALLADTGLTEVARMRREPVGAETSPRGRVLARRN